MKNRIRLLAVVALLFVFSAPISQADCIGFICTDLIHTYYSDSSFTTVVGTWEKDCDDVVTESGTTSDWRKTDSYGCATGNHTTFCAHWTGTAWQQITCP